MKKPTSKEVETAIRVIEYLRDLEDSTAADKINKAPDGKHWDNYVNRLAARCEERNEQLDNLIEDIKLLK